MNGLQEKELELLVVFDDICRRLNLNYYLVCGSALGAAKYGGFIPWDDDIDVAMPRPAYEIFVQEAQKILTPPYFLQNYHFEKNVPHIFSKLRNVNTTYIEKSVSHLDINHGVGIDIFPLDGYPKTKLSAILLEIRKLFFQLQLSCVFEGEKTWKSKIIYMVGRKLKCDKNIYKKVEKLEGILMKYSFDSTELVCNHGNWQGKLEYAPKEQYGKGTMVKFEGLTVRIPERYDEYLTQKYGDWRADLPEEEQKGHHYYEICDLNRSYVDYIEKLPNGKIKLKNKL